MFPKIFSDGEKNLKWFIKTITLKTKNKWQVSLAMAFFYHHKTLFYLLLFGREYYQLYMKLKTYNESCLKKVKFCN